jgi:hypothetical protein
LLSWQERLASHQGPLFNRGAGGDAVVDLQGSLFDLAAAASPGHAAPMGWEDPRAWAERLDPLALQAQTSLLRAAAQSLTTAGRTAPLARRGM